jgi:hypothetical protein
MRVPAGLPFTARLLGPAGLGGVQLGARIEVPVTRAIVGYWRPATLDGGVWSVELEAPPLTSPDPGLVDALAAGQFLIVWMDGGAIAMVEIFVPLQTYAGIGVNGNGTMELFVFAEIEDLETRLGHALVGADRDRGEALLSDASAVIIALAGTNWDGDPPDVIRTLTVTMAMRAFENPKGIRQQTLGDLSMTWGDVSTGVTLTDDERALIRSLVGGPLRLA